MALCISEGNAKAEVDTEIQGKCGPGGEDLASSPGLHHLPQVDIGPVSSPFRDLNPFLSNEYG